jgi:hypothetical protein
MELWVSKKAWDALPDDLKEIVTKAADEFNEDYARVCDEQEKIMMTKSFKEWKTTYIEWGKEDVDKNTNEFSIPTWTRSRKTSAGKTRESRGRQDRQAVHEGPRVHQVARGFFFPGNAPPLPPGRRGPLF